MTHQLLINYGMYKKMEVYRPPPAHEQEMALFHAADYVDFLKRVTPDNSKEFLHQLQRFNLGPFTDCPIFDGLFEFCQVNHSPHRRLHRALKLQQRLISPTTPNNSPNTTRLTCPQRYTGGSIAGAMKLNHGLCDIAVNWAGGLHHAKKSEASGQCRAPTQAHTRPQRVVLKYLRVFDCSR